LSANCADLNRDALKLAPMKALNIGL